jgi:hypothetical protein
MVAEIFSHVHVTFIPDDGPFRCLELAVHTDEADRLDMALVLPNAVCATAASRVLESKVADARFSMRGISLTPEYAPTDTDALIRVLELAPTVEAAYTWLDDLFRTRQFAAVLDTEPPDAKDRIVLLAVTLMLESEAGGTVDRFFTLAVTETVELHAGDAVASTSAGLNAIIRYTYPVADVCVKFKLTLPAGAETLYPEKVIAPSVTPVFVPEVTPVAVPLE